MVSVPPSRIRREFRAGDLLDDRWLVERVLPGAMGSVFILSDPATGTRLAAKTPRLDADLDAATVRRFEVEARNWLTLGAHPNVVEASFLESITLDGVPRPFLFLEYVDGPTLREILEHEGPLAVPVVLDVGTGVAWGMAHAHGEERAGSRLVHRDLKPDNLFLTRDRVVKVSDFGISRALDRAEEVAAEGTGLGTPFYAAPEQLKDARAAGPQSDVYAYGAVLHHLLTGAPPFPATSLAELVLKVLRDLPPAPSTLRDGVPPALDRLVVACLSKSPGERPASFGEVLREISEIREIDALWRPPSGALSCPVCGWLSARPSAVCSVCGGVMAEGVRYAPVSRRSALATPTLGRSAGGELVVEGVEVRPRVVREGESVVITALVGNPGSDPVTGVFVPHVLPDADALDRPSGHRRGFRGDVPPTAADAPLRVSWTVRPLTAGEYPVRTVRATYRDESGVRVAVRGPPSVVRVLPRETLPTVGRERELSELETFLDAADGGACMLLSGRRGLGKSRLAWNARHVAGERGFLVARGRCLGRGVQVRGALKEALRELLALPRDRAGPSETAAAVVALLGDAAHTTPGLLDFLVAELLTRPLPRGESAGVMWGRFAAAIGRVRPFLLVLEDVQRDPDVANIAARMTSHAAYAGASFATLMTARPGLADGEAGRDVLARIERMSDRVACSRVLHLAPLDDAAVAQLTAAAFDPNDFATTVPWLTRRVAELSGGNPLFVAEMLRALRAAPSAAAPLVVVQSGRWTATSALTEEALDGIVPRRLEEIVTARLAELPETVARVARAAGVLGDVFESELLAHVVGNAQEAAAAVAGMEHEGLLRESGDSVANVRFREPLLPEILARQCRLRHAEEWVQYNARAADWLVAREGFEGRQALRVARHLAVAGRAHEAFRGRLAAAWRLSGQQSYRRVADVLRGADELVRDATLELTANERTELAMLRAEALRFSGDYEAALRAYETVVGAPPRGAAGKAELAAAYSRMGRVHEALGHLDEAMRCYATGLSLRVAHGLADDVPMSLVNLAGLHLVRGDVARGEAYIERALRASESVDSPRARGRAHALRGRVLVGRGDAPAARDAVRSALRHARVARDRTTSADAWNVLGMIDMADGRSARARTHFMHALRLRQEIGDLAAVAASWNNVAAVHEALGDRAEALRGYERAVELTRRISSARGLGIALTNVGRMLLDGGRPRLAAPRLAEAGQVLACAGDPVSWAVALAEAARLGVLTAAPGTTAHEEARGSMRRAQELVLHRGDHDAEAAVAEAIAGWHAAQGDHESAVEVARDAARLHGIEPRRRVALLAVVAELGDDRAAAEEALRIAERGGGLRVRARALAALAAVERAAGEEERAAPLLRRAAGLLRQGEVEDPLLLSVLRATATSLRDSDPAASAASAERAAELASQLRKLGYAGV